MHNIRTTSLEPVLPWWAGLGRSRLRGSGEEAEVQKKLVGGLDDAPGLGYSVVRLIDIGRGRTSTWVLELVATSAEIAEPAEAVAELSTKSRIDGDMAPGRGWPQPLLGKEGRGRVPSGVVRKYKSTVRGRSW